MNTTSTGAGASARPAGRDSSPFLLSMPNDLQAALAARAMRNRRTESAEAVALIERGMLVANPVDFAAAGDVHERRRADQVAKQVVDGGLDVERLHADAAKGDGNATVDQLFAAAFAGPRSPRSDEYRAGVRAVLAYRVEGKPIVRPYAAGTPQDDAFDAGQSEGHSIWRNAMAHAAGMP